MDGKHILEQLLWVIIVVIAFTLSGVMVVSNLKDVEDNPISTSIDTIPVQVIEFLGCLKKESFFNKVSLGCSLSCCYNECTHPGQSLQAD